MASAAALPLRTLTFTAALVVVAGASRLPVRGLLEQWYTGPGKYSRIAATLIILLNIKNFPGMWHWRVLKGIFQHLSVSPPKIPAAVRPSVLFLPAIVPSYVPFSECDYNLHKSNSTYYSDLDVARSHLVCALLQPGMHALQNNVKNKLVLDSAGKPVRGKWGIMLGGVHCSFKREIKPYQSYEMWTRLLCWDRKWIYVVTHFVKKGTVRPKAYVLSDGSWFGGKSYTFKGDEDSVEGAAAAVDDIDEKAIFASAISKYVIKLGRLTIHPEITLAAAGYLPEDKPSGWATMATTPSQTSGSTSVTAQDSGVSTPVIVPGESDALDPAAAEEATKDEEKSKPAWKKIVEENERGLEIARHFGALDELHSTFTGSKKAALGRFSDL
ncbi:hypothetical protein DH86_00001652 [Scytalidium sp. 3C]|nr:hypothetical protein DH86_00001652 [Scytalidium sp. 3C]